MSNLITKPDAIISELILLDQLQSDVIRCCEQDAESVQRLPYLSKRARRYNLHPIPFSSPTHHSTLSSQSTLAPPQQFLLVQACANTKHPQISRLPFCDELPNEKSILDRQHRRYLKSGLMIHVPMTRQELHTLTKLQEDNEQDWINKAVKTMPWRSKDDIQRMWKDRDSVMTPSALRIDLLTKYKSLPVSRPKQYPNILLSKQRVRHDYQYSPCKAARSAQLLHQLTCVTDGSSGPVAYISIVDSSRGPVAAVGSSALRDVSYNRVGELRFIWLNEAKGAVIDAHASPSRMHPGVLLRSSVTHIVPLQQAPGFCVSVALDTSTRVWNVESGQAAVCYGDGMKLERHEETSNTLERQGASLRQTVLDEGELAVTQNVASNGRLLVVGGGDGRLFMWPYSLEDSDTLRFDACTNLVENRIFEKYGFTTINSFDDLTFCHAEPHCLATATGFNQAHTGIVEVFDTNACRCIHRFTSFQGGVASVQSAHSEPLLLAGCMHGDAPEQRSDQKLRCFDLRMETKSAEILCLHTKQEIMDTIGFSNDDALIYCSDTLLNETLIFDRRNFSVPLHRLKHTPPPSPQQSIVTSAVWISDRVLATSGYDGHVRIWDLQQQSQPCITQWSHSEPIIHMDLSTDKQWLVYGGDSGAVVIHGNDSLMRSLYARGCHISMA